MFQDRVSLTLRPRNLNSVTLSTAVLLKNRGAWSGRDFLMSTLISLVAITPDCQNFHLSTIGWLVAVCYEPHNCGVICEYKGGINMEYLGRKGNSRGRARCITMGWVSTQPCRTQCWETGWTRCDCPVWRIVCDLWGSPTPSTVCFTDVDFGVYWGVDEVE